MALEFQIVVDDKGSAKVKKFSKNVKNSGNASEKASKALKLFGAGMGLAGAGAVGASVAVFNLAKGVAEAQDKITKMGRELGVSTEFLSSLEFSAKLAGTSLDSVDKGLSKMARTAQDAQNGSLTASRAFTDLGIAVKNQNGTFKESDEILLEISDKFKDMPNGVLKTAKAQEIFGKSGKQMINLLNQGSDALKEQAEEAEHLGLTFDQEAGESAEAFNDQLLRMEQTFTGLGQEVGQEIIPILTDLFNDILMGVEIARPAITSFFSNMVGAIEVVAEELSDFVLGWSQIAKEIDDFFGNDKELNVMITPEGQARLDRLAKREKEEEEQKKKAEKQAKNSEKLKQQREMKARKDAEIRRKEREREKKREKEEAKREAERAIKTAERLAEAEKKARNKQKEEDEKTAKERADNIIEINKEISLALMSDNARNRELSRIAHQERLTQGATELESAKLMAQELAIIKAQEEEARKQSRETQMQQFTEGFANASQALSNINQIEQSKISERFEERKAEMQSTFDAEIKGAEGNAEKQKQIKTKRDEALKQLDLKRDKALAESSKKLAGIRKAIAMGEAISNGALAITRALAEGGPFAGPILATGIGVTTATQVGLIAQQKLFEGGMIKGKDTTMLTTNENGQESVLNRRGTSSVGESALNDFNSGRTQDALDKIQSSISGSSGGGVTLNIKGGVVDRRFMNETLIPQLTKVMRRV